jgi:hypothetical protein
VALYPKTIAAESMNWSASVLAGGRQTVETVLERTTGISSETMAISLAYTNQNVKEFITFDLVVSTYIGGGIVSAVDDNFADSPRHLDVGLITFVHANQYGHTRNVKHRHSFFKYNNNARKQKNVCCEQLV